MGTREIKVAVYDKRNVHCLKRCLLTLYNMKELVSQDDVPMANMYSSNLAAINTEDKYQRICGRKRLQCGIHKGLQ